MNESLDNVSLFKSLLLPNDGYSRFIFAYHGHYNVMQRIQKETIDSLRIMIIMQGESVRELSQIEKNIIDKHINELPYNEGTIIRMLFGINQDVFSFHDVGNYFSISHIEVKKIRDRVLGALKKGPAHESLDTICCKWNSFELRCNRLSRQVEQLQKELTLARDELSSIQGNKPTDQASSSVFDLPLPTRAYNALKMLNIQTFDDLYRYNEAMLLSVKNFGKHSLSELNELLLSHGQPVISK